MTFGPLTVQADPEAGYLAYARVNGKMQIVTDAYKFADTLVDKLAHHSISEDDAVAAIKAEAEKDGYTSDLDRACFFDAVTDTLKAASILLHTPDRETSVEPAPAPTPEETIHQNRAVYSDYYAKLPDRIKAEEGKYDEAARDGSWNWLAVVQKTNGKVVVKVELPIPWPTETVYREYDRNGVVVKQQVNSTQLVGQ